ncbi:MAG TPA: HAMP domain-containing sensor histidine kinase [Solirubrobacteraceae bacterium]
MRDSTPAGGAGGAALGATRRDRPRGIRSIKNRLALLFFSITFAAITVVYLYVAPTLGSSLRAQKVHSLAIAAKAYARPLTQTAGERHASKRAALAVRHAAALSSDRVTLLGVSTGPQPGMFYVYDSSTEVPGTRGGSNLHFPVAFRAARAGRLLTGIETGSGGPVGEAAKPLFYKGTVAEVAVFSGTLSDVDRSVAQIRERILIAGAIALAFSLAAGYMLARVLSLRVERLELAARRVAAGDFSARFPVDSADELGKLAGALDSMRQQLAELDRARERFIAVASHELRTPIFSLGGFLELIQDEDLDEDTRRQFMEQLRTQVERLGKLTTGLLDLSRLEAGGLDLHRERADLCEIVDNVSAEFIPALAAHSSTLRPRVAHNPIYAVCDPERVAQILRILIDNAITHTPLATNIIVAASSEEDSARLSVRDFGAGIEPSTLGRVFEPFFTSDGVQGSGLGLAIAHELADRMDGQLTVSSTPGRTVFTLTLPS